MCAQRSTTFGAKVPHRCLSSPPSNSVLNNDSRRRTSKLPEKRVFMEEFGASCWGQLLLCYTAPGPPPKSSSRCWTACTTSNAHRNKEEIRARTNEIVLINVEPQDVLRIHQICVSSTPHQLVSNRPPSGILSWLSPVDIAISAFEMSTCRAPGRRMGWVVGVMATGTDPRLIV